ncbi:MAG: hypothetical protein V3T86_10900 [Planctomycetota bacterium]
MHELRGFTEDESKRYLVERGVDEELIDAIIDQCPEVPNSDQIKWDHEPNSDPLAPDKRVNPYELNLFADWAREDPAPEEEEIRRATGAQYVEQRILRRINFEPLTDLLPILAAVKFIDRDLIAKLTGTEGEPLDLVVTALADQEWIEIIRGEGGETGSFGEVFTMGDPLRGRMLKYYGDGDLLIRAANRARPFLEARTLEGTPSWTSYDACIRAIEHDRDKAHDWWEAAVGIILQQRDYAWLAELTSALLGSAVALPADEDARKGREPSILRPAVLAASASARLQAGGPVDTTAYWNEVEASVISRARGDHAAIYVFRAQAGALVSAAARYDELDPRVTKLFWRGALGPGSWRSLFERRALSACVAGVEAIVEMAETGNSGEAETRDRILGVHNGSSGAVRLAMRWRTTNPDSPATAMMASLAARSAALQGKWKEMRTWFRISLELARSYKEPAQSLIDWRRPEDLLVRLQVEALRAVWPAQFSPLRALEFVGPLEPAGHGLDGDRLRSLAIRCSTADRPSHTLPVHLADVSKTSVQLEVDGHSRCLAHVAVAPAFVSFAESMAARGRVEDAVRILKSALSRSSEIGPAALHHTQEALYRIGIRFRLAEVDLIDLGRVTLETPNLAGFLLLARAHLGDETQARHIDPRGLEGANRVLWIHALWRSSLGGEQDLTQIFDSLTDNERAIEGVSLEQGLAVLLDQTELQVIESERPGLRASGGKIDLGSLRPIAKQSFAALVRLDALIGRRSGALERQARRHGVHLAGETALREATAISLRMPDRARKLAVWACHWFREAGDAVGEFQATICFALFAESRSERGQALEDAMQLGQTLIQREQLGREWEKITEVFDSHEYEWIEQQIDRAWQPWATRFAYVHALVSDAGLEARRFKETTIWRDFPSPSDWRLATVLPPEAHPELADEDDEDMENGEVQVDTSAPVTAPASASASRRTKALRNWPAILRDLGYGVFGLGILGTIGFWVFRGYSMVLEFVADGPVSFGWRIGTLLGLVLSGSYLFSVRRQIRSWVLAGIGVRLAIERADEYAVVSDRTLTARERVRFQVNLHTVRFYPRQFTNFIFRTFRVAKGLYRGETYAEGLDAYCTTPLEFDGIAPEIQTGPRLQPRIDLELSLPEYLHGPCWEAQVHSALLGERPFDLANLRLYCRRVTDRHGARNPSWRGSTLELGAGWPVESIDLDSSAETLTEQDWRELQPREDVHGLRLVGSPVETDSGTAIRIDMQDSKSGALLVRPSDVRQRFPRLHICLVRASRVSGTGPRYDTDRHNASLARMFAHELHDSGVGAVIVVPPHCSHKSMQALYAAWDRPKLKLRTLQRAVVETQVEISKDMESYYGNKTDAWEAALDVCLYAGANWKFHA